MDYIPTNDNITDVFTKALGGPKFTGIVEGMGLRELEKRGQEQ